MWGFLRLIVAKFIGVVQKMRSDLWAKISIIGEKGVILSSRKFSAF